MFKPTLTLLETKSVKALASVAIVLLLASCSSVPNCDDEGVKDLARQSFADIASKFLFVTVPVDVEAVKASYQKTDVGQVVTTSTDKGTGHKLCKAVFTYATPGGRTASATLEYGVEKVDSDDADFQIIYDESAFRHFVAVGNELFVQEIREQLQQERRQLEEKAKAEQDAYAAQHPPLPMTGEEKQRLIAKAFDEMISGGKEIPGTRTVVESDTNGDGLMDLLLFVSILEEGNGPRMYFAHLIHTPGKAGDMAQGTPGTMASFSSTPTAGLVYGIVVASAQLDGNTVTVVSRDGKTVTGTLTAGAYGDQFAF